MSLRHFLTLSDLTKQELENLIKRASELRKMQHAGEILSLGDYRRRYALYRTDPDLSELHRLHPMICIWDDHEFANDPKAGGAQNHTPATEGDWFQRVGFATQAHAEWMPTRVEGDVAYRSLQFGSLATLVLVDRQRRYLFPQPDDGDLYLGRAQAEWLDATLSAAESTWVILGSPSNFGPNVAGQTGGGWGLRDRTRAINAFRASRSGNLVVAVGDIHKFRAMDIPFVPGQYDRSRLSHIAGSDRSQPRNTGEVQQWVFTRIHTDDLHRRLRRYRILRV